MPRSRMSPRILPLGRSFWLAVMTGADRMVVCARLNEREWWNTLRGRGEVAERRFESGRLQSRGTKIPLSLSLTFSRSLLLRSRVLGLKERRAQQGPNCSQLFTVNCTLSVSLWSRQASRRRMIYFWFFFAKLLSPT